MEYPGYIDAEMRELMEELGRAIVPRRERRAVIRANRHVPYYSSKRYKRI